MDLHFDPEHHKEAHFSYIRYRSVLHHRLSYLISRLGLSALIFLTLAIPCFYFALRHHNHNPRDIAAVFAAMIIFAFFLGIYLALLAWELNFVTRLGKQ